ncbi:MAG TPA: rod shape-determining protein RodA [Holophagaceae bacterium]|nr:rod shape-determining protein RodA [Holophagaceae bacterium]HJW32246.1 rod shape-determining protein RodA [Holophagaceae bacterium]
MISWRESLKGLDRGLLAIMAALAALGILTLFSASRGTAQADLWLKQLTFTLGCTAMVAILASVDPTRIFKVSLGLYLLGLFLLLLVLVAGKKMGGAARWFEIKGVQFQPSELMKWLTLLFVAHRLGSRPADQVGAFDLLTAAALVLLPMVLVLKQPDLGMALSFTPTLALVPLIRGLKAKWVVIGLLCFSLGGVVAWKKVLKPYQKQRVMTFLDPESDLQGKGYQIHQSKIAIGAGGVLGRGFTAGSQTQLNFLPVKTTDFVFAVWAEERGFVGVLIALSLFGALLLRILDTARLAKTPEELYFCAGAAAIFGLHILVNVGMVAGALPNKGMALPFFSYGRSSTLSFMLALGMVMSIRNRARVR